jgi:DNA-binding Lrp family transcriptional regulator
MTATALASKVGLTVAPCHRRLRDLEVSGVIRGYRADVDPAAVGLGFEAIVFVTLRQVERTILPTSASTTKNSQPSRLSSVLLQRW